jgi:hypothetical protein
MRSKAPQPLNLDPLNSHYEILGELADRKDARRLLAKRRSDGAPVMISVFQAPARDQGNALSHLAADVNRFTGLQAPNLIPVLAGHWVGTDAFAIATPRVDSPTLAEVLSRRGEDFAYARVAKILREVNVVIEWARAQKFVHRAVDLDTIHLDPGSDQVRVTFAVRALPRTGMPTAVDDARNLAALARAMLTRSPVAPEREEQPLAELRPGLPVSLLRETDALLAMPQGRGSGEMPDVTGYISRLAMAEDLKRGELHVEKSRNAIKEAHRKAKAEIEAQRRSHEEQLTAARAEHERLVAEQASNFARERAEFESELDKQRQELSKEREALTSARAANARASEALAREREAHKRDCDALAKERAAHREQAAALTAQIAQHRHLMADERERLTAKIEEQQHHAAEERKQLLARVSAEQRQAAEERKRIANELEALQRQTADERKQAAALLAARLEEQKRAATAEKQRIADQLAQEKRAAAEEKKRLAAQVAIVAANAPRSAPMPPVPPKPEKPKPPKPPKPSGPRAWPFALGAGHLYSSVKSRFTWRRSWNAPAMVAGVLLFLAGVTLAISARRDEGREELPGAAAVAPVQAAPSISSTAPTVVIDSIGGGVTPVADSTRATITTRPRPTPAVEESNVTTAPPVRPDTTPIRVEIPSAFDLMGVSPIPLREGNTRLDSVGRPARDSARPRRDSFPRFDIIPRRDSTPKP